MAYCASQVTNDTSSAFYGNAINANRYDVWAVGGLVAYDFGPVQLNVRALNEVPSKTSGGTPVAGTDSATVNRLGPGPFHCARLG